MPTIGKYRDMSGGAGQVGAGIASGLAAIIEAISKMQDRKENQEFREVSLNLQKMALEQQRIQASGAWQRQGVKDQTAETQLDMMIASHAEGRADKRNLKNNQRIIKIETELEEEYTALLMASSYTQAPGVNSQGTHPNVQKLQPLQTKWIARNSAHETGRGIEQADREFAEEMGKHIARIESRYDALFALYEDNYNNAAKMADIMKVPEGARQQLLAGYEPTQYKNAAIQDLEIRLDSVNPETKKVFQEQVLANFMDDEENSDRVRVNGEPFKNVYDDHVLLPVATQYDEALERDVLKPHLAETLADPVEADKFAQRNPQITDEWEAEKTRAIAEMGLPENVKGSAAVERQAMRDAMQVLDMTIGGPKSNLDDPIEQFADYAKNVWNIVDSDDGMRGSVLDPDGVSTPRWTLKDVYENPDKFIPLLQGFEAKTGVPAPFETKEPYVSGIELAKQGIDPTSKEYVSQALQSGALKDEQLPNERHSDSLEDAAMFGPTKITVKRSTMRGAMALKDELRRKEILGWLEKEDARQEKGMKEDAARKRAQTLLDAPTILSGEAQREFQEGQGRLSNEFNTPVWTPPSTDEPADQYLGTGSTEIPTAQSLVDLVSGPGVPEELPQLMESMVREGAPPEILESLASILQDFLPDWSTPQGGGATPMVSPVNMQAP